MFHRMAALIIVLAFGISFTILAQQKSVWIETETATAQDADAASLEAKVAAEQDANSDVNKLLWFGAGVGTCCIGGAIGYLAGGTVASLLDPIPVNSSTPYDIGGVAVGWSAVVGGLIPLIGIYNYQGDPPPERLLGKSPKYVEFYTDAYKTKTRSLRTKWAAAGTAAIVIGLGFYANTQ